MTSSAGLLRVSRARPCPVCGKRDWCLVAADQPASVAICARIESPKRAGDAGWLHRLRDVPTCRAARRTVRVATVARTPDLGCLAAEYAAAADDAAVGRLAETLGVTDASLRRMGIGWTGCEWSFPMLGSGLQICGIRLRRPDGRKFAVRGGREGLFVASGVSGSGLLLVAEGPTDAAALLGLGFDVIGRPSCSGGSALAAAFVTRVRSERVVVVADADPQGRKGAADLAKALAPRCADVRVITPPAKDAREWVRGGGTRSDVCAAIDRAPCLRVAITLRRAGR